MHRPTPFLAALAACLAGSVPAMAEQASIAEFVLSAEQVSGEVAEGGVTARLSVRTVEREEIGQVPVPVLALLVEGRIVLETEGEFSGTNPPYGRAQIVEMDRSNAWPEVVFSSFTGGTHCCTQVTIARASPDGGGWSFVDAGAFDGVGDFIGDVDADGTAEIVAVDGAFLYAFDCYACSAAPINLLAFVDGGIVEVTHEPRFLPAHREHLAYLDEWGRSQKKDSSNGFLAGWVAAKALAGQGQEAWALMLQSYDREARWGLDSCRTSAPLEDCLPSDIVTKSFPETLKALLDERGYEIE